jgi:hypothetical protein
MNDSDCFLREKYFNINNHSLKLLHCLSFISLKFLYIENLQSEA